MEQKNREEAKGRSRGNKTQHSIALIIDVQKIESYGVYKVHAVGVMNNLCMKEWMERMNLVLCGKSLIWVDIKLNICVKKLSIILGMIKSH